AAGGRAPPSADRVQRPCDAQGSRRQRGDVRVPRCIRRSGRRCHRAGPRGTQRALPLARPRALVAARPSRAGGPARAWGYRMKVLVAITEPERETALLETAAALACGGEVVLASVIEVTGDAALASAQPEARGRRRALDALAADLGPGRHVRSLVTVARRGWDAIREACTNERPDLLLVGWRRPGWDLLGTTIEEILRNPPSDVAIVKGAPARARRILVPVRGGRYAQLAARLGIELARAHDGAVTLLHVAEQGGGRQRSTLYQLLGERAYDERVERLVTRSGAPARGIGEELAEHDAIVF